MMNCSQTKSLDNMILQNNVVGQFMYKIKGAESKSGKQFLLFFFPSLNHHCCYCRGEWGIN